ncbi:unnamed protein product [Leptidea sinapis]|uniref:DUF4794 domain-containing protein n=1 Tax=Leptidea sinapis TaxID=189913 RepID=A0A5E4Q3V7_9NEOP|nr:unnamed protein product [Leptidea sinapis]
MAVFILLLLLKMLNYYLDGQPTSNFYNQAPERAANSKSDESANRLETLEPDSEVELIPGAQPPQQPPQQVPVSPNLPGLQPGSNLPGLQPGTSLPGLQPGQRVFIVQMPIPGYRPGTIGGYQPVYIVAAAPLGNTAYPGQGVVNPAYSTPGAMQPNIPLGVQFLNNPVQPYNYTYRPNWRKYQKS